jgi:hypothetical protein
VRSPLHGKARKPRGHYTARLQTRLPIARFRRFFINRRTREWLHRNATKIGWSNATGFNQKVKGIAMPPCGG